MTPGGRREAPQPRRSTGALFVRRLPSAFPARAFGEVEVLRSLRKRRHHPGVCGLDLGSHDLDVEVRHPGFTFADEENAEGYRPRFIWNVEHHLVVVPVGRSGNRAAGHVVRMRASGHRAHRRASRAQPCFRRSGI